MCRSEQKSAYGGAKGLSSEIECHVESKPGATSFRWAFNGTGELVELTNGYRTTADGSISILRYTPRGELDFGTLLCWASNPLGTQQQPCVYHFYAAGIKFNLILIKCATLRVWSYLDKTIIKQRTYVIPQLPKDLYCLFIAILVPKGKGSGQWQPSFSIRSHKVRPVRGNDGL